MRYALIFAGVAAAYDAYGYETYPESKASSSTPAVKYSTSAPAYGGYGEGYKTSSAPAPSKSSSSSKLGYTTIYPGYGKQPVTVTSQYQPYPTCGAAGSDGKSCNKWKEDKYVSTVITDCNSKKVTVTHVEKPITVYQTKTTITHYPTASAPGGEGKAYPTGSYGSYGAKKNATQPWYELSEKIHEIKYKDLGVHGLPGYGGSGLCKSCDDEQPYKVKEYKDGKWSEYETTAIYKAPTPDVKTYEKPGVYTEPAKDVTVTYTMTKPSEATTTAKAGVPVTYGGYTTDFKETGVKTCAYGAYETGKDNNGNDVTSTVVKTVTVTVSTTGQYEVAKPTTTVYAHDTEVTYPTVSVYQPGVYHKDAQTVTITKAGETASCEYKQTKTYPAQPEKTPGHGGEYPPSGEYPHGGKSSSTPAAETKTEYKPDYPAYTPSASSSKPVNEYPATSSAPSYPEYPASSSTPVYDTEKSSSTPCASSSSKPSVDTKTYPAYPQSTPVYGEGYPPYGASSSTPAGETKTSSVPYPEYPASSSTPVYETEKSSSTPCPSSTPAVDTKTYPAYPHSTPVHGEGYPPYGVSSSKPSVETKTSSVHYPEYPASSSTPVYETGKSSSTPCPSSTPAVDTKTYPAHPASTPVYGGEYPPSKPSSSKPAVETSTKPAEYPHSTPVYGGAYPPAETSSVPAYPATTTVPHYENGKSTPCPSSTQPAVEYKTSAYPEYPAASSSAPVYEAKPTPTPSYEESKGYSYAKRAGAVQRRQAAKREVV